MNSVFKKRKSELITTVRTSEAKPPGKAYKSYKRNRNSTMNKTNGGI